MNIKARDSISVQEYKRTPMQNAHEAICLCTFCTNVPPSPPPKKKKTDCTNVPLYTYTLMQLLL